MEAKKTAQMGIMLGIIIVLSLLEQMIALPFMPPHAKPGFANIVIMYGVFAMGKKQGITLNILKSLFVLATRGPMAGLLSITGGMLSILIIILLAHVKKEHISFIAISVAGALTHSLGQFAVFILLMRSPALLYYLPLLIVSGAISGIITGTLLRAIMPVLSRQSSGQRSG